MHNVAEDVYSIEKISVRCAMHDKDQLFWSKASGASESVYPWKTMDHSIFQETSILKACDKM